MSSTVKITYREEPYSLKMVCNDNTFDTTRIKGMPINEWAFPFSKKGAKWNGIYDELKEFTSEDDFIVYFDGDEDSFETIKYSLQDTPARLISTSNVVVILYSENPFTTKITVNGSVFNTTRIQNRSIDEWINPIHIRDLNWQGIFKELEDFIGIDIYNIQFVGKQEFMKLLVENCPPTVDVTYRMPNNIGTGNKKETVNLKFSNTAKSESKLNVQNISAVSGQVKDKMKQEISDDELNQNIDNIPIKNAFIKKNAMAICAVLSIVFTFLPFCGFGAKAEVADASALAEVKASGFDALFGIEQLKVLGNNKTLFAITLFLIPVLIIVMNYIKQLKPYRRLIAIVAPAASIVCEILTVIFLRSHVVKYFNAGGGADVAGVEFNTSLKIGFWLLLASYILTAVVGFITYYGLQLPKKKK